MGTVSLACDHLIQNAPEDILTLPKRRTKSSLYVGADTTQIV